MSDDEDDALPEPMEITEELIQETIKLMGQPRKRPEPGDPFYEVDKLIHTCMMCKRDKRGGGEPCEFCKPPPKYPDNAPEGQIFVCGACGKTSRCIYGDKRKDGTYTSWDESCMLNAVLCYEDKKTPEGNWIAVDGY